jgi:hypothetical protein
MNRQSKPQNQTSPDQEDDDEDFAPKPKHRRMKISRDDDRDDDEDAAVLPDAAVVPAVVPDAVVEEDQKTKPAVHTCANCKQIRHWPEWNKIAKHYTGENAIWDENWTCNKGRNNVDETNYCSFVRCSNEYHEEIANEMGKPELVWRYLHRKGSKETQRGSWLKLMEYAFNKKKSNPQKTTKRIISGEWVCSKNGDLCILSNARKARCSNKDCQKIRNFDGTDKDWSKATGVAPVEKYNDQLKWTCGTALNEERLHVVQIDQYTKHDVVSSSEKLWDVEQYSYCDFVICATCRQWRLLDQRGTWFRFVVEILRQKNPGALKDDIVTHIKGDPKNVKWTCPYESITGTDANRDRTCYMKNDEQKLDQPSVILDPEDPEGDLNTEVPCSVCQQAWMVSENSPIIQRDLKALCLFSYDRCRKAQSDQETGAAETENAHGAMSAVDDSSPGFYVRGLVMRDLGTTWVDNDADVRAIEQVHVRSVVKRILKEFDNVATKKGNYSALLFWQTLHAVTELYIDFAFSKASEEWIRNNGWRYVPPDLVVDTEEATDPEEPETNVTTGDVVDTEEDTDTEEPETNVTIGEVVEFEMLSREFFTVLIDLKFDDQSVSYIERLSEYVGEAEIDNLDSNGIQSLLQVELAKPETNATRLKSKLIRESDLFSEIERSVKKVPVRSDESKDRATRLKSIFMRRSNLFSRIQRAAIKNIKNGRAFKKVKAHESKDRYLLLDVAEHAILEMSKLIEENQAVEEDKGDDDDDDDHEAHSLGEFLTATKNRNKARQLRNLAQLILNGLYGNILGELVYLVMCEHAENDELFRDLVKGIKSDETADIIEHNIIEAYKADSTQLPYSLVATSTIGAHTEAATDSASVQHTDEDPTIRKIIDKVMRDIRSKEAFKAERKRKEKMEAHKSKRYIDHEEEDEEKDEEYDEKEITRRSESDYTDKILEKVGEMVTDELERVIDLSIRTKKGKEAKKGTEANKGIKYLIEQSKDAADRDYLDLSRHKDDIIKKATLIIRRNIHHNDGNEPPHDAESMKWVASLLAQIAGASNEWKIPILSGIAKLGELSLEDRWNAMRIARDIIAKRRVERFITGTSLIHGVKKSRKESDDAEVKKKEPRFDDIHATLTPSSLRPVSVDEWKKKSGVRLLNIRSWKQHMSNLTDPLALFDFGVSQTMALLLGAYVPDCIKNDQAKAPALSEMFGHYEAYIRNPYAAYTYIIGDKTVKESAVENLYRRISKSMTKYQIESPTWLKFQDDEDGDIMNMKSLVSGRQEVWATMALSRLRTTSIWSQLLGINDIWANIGNQASTRTETVREILNALQALIEKGGYKRSITIYEEHQHITTRAHVVPLPPLVDLAKTETMLELCRDEDTHAARGYALQKFGIVDPDVALELSNLVKTSRCKDIVDPLAKAASAYVEYNIDSDDEYQEDIEKAKSIGVLLKAKSIGVLLGIVRKAQQESEEPGSYVHAPLALHYRKGYYGDAFNTPGWASKKSRDAMLDIHEKGYKPLWEATIGLEKKIMTKLKSTIHNLKERNERADLLREIEVSQPAIWINHMVRDLAAGRRIYTEANPDQTSILAMCGDLDRTTATKTQCIDKTASVLLNRMILGYKLTTEINKNVIRSTLQGELGGVIDDYEKKHAVINRATDMIRKAIKSTNEDKSPHSCNISDDQVNENEKKLKEAAVSACGDVIDKIRVMDDLAVQTMMYLVNTDKKKDWTKAESKKRADALVSADKARDKAALDLLDPIVQFLKEMPQLRPLFGRSSNNFGGPKRPKAVSAARRRDDDDDHDEPPAPVVEKPTRVVVSVANVHRDLEAAGDVKARETVFYSILFERLDSTLSRVADAMGATKEDMVRLILAHPHASAFGVKKSGYAKFSDRDKGDLDKLVDVHALVLPQHPFAVSEFRCLLKWDLDYDELDSKIDQHKLSEKSAKFLTEVLDRVIRPKEEASELENDDSALLVDELLDKKQQVIDEIIEEKVITKDSLGIIRKLIMSDTVNEKLFASSALFFEKEGAWHLARPVITGRYYCLGEIKLSVGGDSPVVQSGYDPIVLQHSVTIDHSARTFLSDVCKLANVPMKSVASEQKLALENKDLEPIRAALQSASINLALVSLSCLLYIYINPDGTRALCAETPSYILGAPYAANEQSRPDGPCVRSRHEIVLETYSPTFSTASFGSAMGSFI